MLQKHHISRRFGSVVGNIGLGCVALVLALCPGVAGAVEADLAREAYGVAENWVKRNAVPEQPLSIMGTRIDAVHATLRLEGWAAGQATAVATPAEGKEDEPLDVMVLVGSAIRGALEEAAANLLQRGIALKEGNRLVLDLQLAGRLEEVRLGALAELPRKITINRDGLAMGSGGRLAWSFPGNGVATNGNLNTQLTRMLAELGETADRKPLIGTPQGPALFRFEVVHITRPASGGEAVVLYRGQELLPTEPLTDQGLVLLGEQLADVLVQRQREDGRFAGTYHPTPDHYQPETADTSSTALAVYALARASKLGGAGRASREGAAVRGLGALVKLSGVRDPSSRQVIGQDAEATALGLLALMETPGGDEFKEVRDRWLAALKTMQEREGRFRSSLAADSPPAPPAVQGAATAALVRLFDALREPDLGERAIRGYDAALQHTAEEDRYRLLPWIVFARADMLRLGQPDPGEFPLPTTQVGAWVDAERQPSPDTVGGYILGTRLFAEPTYESAWVLAASAVAMRDGGETPEKAKAQRLVSAGLAARFLSQLTLAEGGAYYTRNPREAVGGVRVALYDNRQPLEATAAALLAVTELRHTLAEWIGE